jgi:hypothetical protein
MWAGAVARRVLCLLVACLVPLTTPLRWLRGTHRSRRIDPSRSIFRCSSDLGAVDLERPLFDPPGFGATYNTTASQASWLDPSRIHAEGEIDASPLQETPTIRELEPASRFSLTFDLASPTPFQLEGLFCAPSLDSSFDVDLLFGGAAVPVAPVWGAVTAVALGATGLLARFRGADAARASNPPTAEPCVRARLASRPKGL